MKNTTLIKKLYKHFDEMEFCVYTDDEFEILYIHHGLSYVIIEEDIINISFEINCEPIVAAVITRELMYFASKYDMYANIFDTYADIVNEDGEVQNVLFGEEALEYDRTGELPIREIIGIEKENSVEDNKANTQKQVDIILDQINTNGMKSLSKEQKQFLVNFSKGKNEHKH